MADSGEIESHATEAPTSFQLVLEPIEFTIQGVCSSIAHMATLRVVKLVVVPFAVVDDGEHLHEVEIVPLEVPGDKVDDFVGGGLAEALKKLAAQHEQ